MSIKPNATGKPSQKDRPQKNDLFHLAEDIIFNIGVGIYLVQDGNFVYVSPLYQKLSGYSDTELLGTYSLKHVHPDDKEMVREMAVRSLKEESANAYEYRFIRQDGDVMWVLEMVTSIVYRGERATLGSFMDITERKQMEEIIRQSEERYRTIIDEMEEWYFETDLAGNFLFFNEAVARALKYTEKEWTGIDVRTFIRPEDADVAHKIVRQVCQTGEPIKNFPHELVLPDGSVKFAEFSIFPKRDQEGQVFGFRGVGHDITERKRIEQKLNYMATHDYLTELPNRMLFMDRLKVALTQAKRNTQKLAVLLLDLDGFKNVNDTWGHNVGDQLLKEMGCRLTALLRQTDTVARLGGDEFIILLPEIERKKDTVEVAQKILKVFEQPFILDDHKLNSTISIGIAIYPDDCQDIDSLLKNADSAMYQAKAHGRNRYRFFTGMNLI